MAGSVAAPQLDREAVPYASGTMQAGALVRRRASNRHYDWAALRDAYVMGIELPADPGCPPNVFWPSLRQLASAFGYDSDARIRAVASQQRWAQQREEYQMLHSATLQRQRAEELAERAVTVHTQTLEVAEIGLQLIINEMRTIAANMAHASDEEVGGTEEWKPNSFSASAVLSLARAAKQYFEMAHVALGPELASLRAAEAELLHQSTQPDIDDELPWDEADRFEQIMQLLRRCGIIADEKRECSSEASYSKVGS